MSVKIIKCFIASPGDTAIERDLCDKVFSEINKTIGEKFNFRIESLRWEKDTIPAFGSYSQEVINEQLGNEYELFIGVMHLKFGTPTDVAGSGTEEEFDNAYKRIVNKEKIEIMFYFNNQSPKNLSDINLTEYEKVNAFKRKIANLGGYYWHYNGSDEFESTLRQHLNNFLIKEYGKPLEVESKSFDARKVALEQTFTSRLNYALCNFNTQPIIWVNPILSITNDISQNPDKNFKNRASIEDIINNPTSTVIKAPPQFGLTCLAHYLVNQDWKNGDLWIYIDSSKIKTHNSHNAVNNEAHSLGFQLADVKCIVVDSWHGYEASDFKKLKNLSDANKNIPILLMHTIDDSKFFSGENEEVIDREFDVLHLLALPRTQIRKVVCEYNKAKGIGEEDVVLSKVVADLDFLNIHRTPLNCLTLLKVSEKHFDESPVNRTNMLEMVLFVLFNMDELPAYKTKPDLKDCEYIIGRFCENLIRNDFYEFSRELFLSEIKRFCEEKLIDIDVDIVFDVLVANNILVRKNLNYIFRASYWIFYFAAKRMHNDETFCDYIFSSKKYISFPEIIEFYTGIDRNRADALKTLCDDIRQTCDTVIEKVGLSENMNPLHLIQWRPTEEQILMAQNEISENVINSSLPESIKDQHADKAYNQIRPYNQSIQAFFDEYSVQNLMQKIKASSRALRNSDYVDINLKRNILKEVLRSWEQISNVLFALTPVLASKGQAQLEGANFELSGNFGDSFDERVQLIIQCIQTNVVGFFKDDLFSKKIGPLLYEQFVSEKNSLKKHQLALLFIFTRPREWKKHIEDYIVSLSKNSYYLYDTVNTLRAKYRYDFTTTTELKEIEYLFKMGLAKHEFGDKKPGLNKIVKISNANLPKREYDD